MATDDETPAPPPSKGTSLRADGTEVKDGFRKRRKRRQGWLAGAIKRGEVRDPNGPDPD